jgi:hypothetical protein
MRKLLAVAGLTAGAVLGGAGAAQAATVTQPAFQAVITGPHSIRLTPGESVVVGEMIRPETPWYTSYVPVTSVTGTPATGESATTGWTFLPLNYIGKTVTFQVVSVPQ